MAHLKNDLHFNHGLVGAVLVCQLLVLDLQVRDGDLQLLVDLQPAVVDVAKNRRLLRQILKSQMRRLILVLPPHTIRISELTA